MQIIQTDDFVTLGQQAGGEVGTEETSGSGDKITHEDKVEDRSALRKTMPAGRQALAHGNMVSLVVTAEANCLYRATSWMRKYIRALHFRSSTRCDWHSLAKIPETTAIVSAVAPPEGV